MSMINFEYIDKGYCTYKPGSSLKEQTRKIPSKYGIYIFHRNSKDGEVLYVGKCGTIQHNGFFKSQSLRKRINNRYSKELSREKWLISKFQEDPFLKELYIEWYVIDQHQYLPGYLEACIIQHHYTQTQHLPKWNKEF